MSLPKLGPNWEVAKLHGIATRPGIVQGNKLKSDHLICPCCLNVIQKSQAPLCDNSKELQFLGFGFPLFYVFLKYCIIMLLITFCSYNALAINWSISESVQNCSSIKGGCTSWMVEIARIQKTASGSEVVARISSFFMQLFSLVYIRDLMIKTRNYYDERTTSLSDYSILVENLPHKSGNKRKLLAFLENSLGKEYKPTQITLISQYNKYFELQEYCASITDQIKQCMLQPENLHYERLLVGLRLQLSEAEEKMEEYCRKQINLEESDECIAAKMIFSCETEDQKWEILSQFNELDQDIIRGVFGVEPEESCKISFAEAPEPKEISWQHINYPEHKRILRIVAGWGLTVLFLLCITAIFFFILSEKASLVEHADHSQHNLEIADAIVYIALILVILFNKFIMGFVLHKICRFQLHNTTAQLEFHFAIKYAVGMFFTTALMTLFVEDIRFHNFYLHPYGVIQEETIMCFMNGFFVPLIWLINPWQIYVLIKRKKNYGNKDMTQKQANFLMENFHYNMGKRYAEILEIMWFTYLYMSLIPIGVAITIVGLILYYWVDKYNLLRRASVPSNIAGEISIYMMGLLDFTLILKPAGEIIFDFQLRDGVPTSSIVMIVIGFIYMVLPTDQILQFFHDEKFKNEEKKYSDVEPFFKETYQTLHPIYTFKKENQERILTGINTVEKLLVNVLERGEEDERKNSCNSFSQMTSPKNLKVASNDLQSLFRSILPQKKVTQKRVTVQDVIEQE